jgi:hypothetical protein
VDDPPKVKPWMLLVILGFAPFLLVSLAIKSWPAELEKICLEYPELVGKIQQCPVKSVQTVSEDQVKIWLDEWCPDDWVWRDDKEACGPTPEKEQEDKEQVEACKKNPYGCYGPG